MRTNRANMFTILFVLCQIIFFPIVLIWILLVLPNSQWHGFGVDSEGNVYIAKQAEIQCYYENNLISTFCIQGYKAFSITIQPDNTLLAVLPDQSHTYDLRGKLLSVSEESDTILYNKLLYRTSVQSSNGSEYSCSRILGYTRISNHNGVILYQTPISEYVMLILGTISFLLMMITIFAMLILHSPKSSKIN